MRFLKFKMWHVYLHNGFFCRVCECFAFSPSGKLCMFFAWGSVSLGCHSDSGLTDSGAQLHHGKWLYRLSASMDRQRTDPHVSSGSCWISAFSGLSLEEALMNTGGEKKLILNFSGLCVCALSIPIVCGFLNLISL